MISKRHVYEWPGPANLRTLAAGGWSALTVLSLVASQAAAQTNTSCAVPSARLHSEVLDIHNKQKNVGLAVALRRGQELVFRADVGLADLEHQVAVDSTTVFGVASVTKLFTAAALLRLYAEGRVDLDAVVQRYVPEFPRHDAGDITVRMLATHRSGIPHPQERTPRLFATHYPTAMAGLEVFTDDTLVAVPNTRRVYSSSNYNLLAAIMEQIQGTAFPNVVTELVLDPLHLNHTLIDDVLRPTAGRSERYSFYHPWTYAPSDSLYVVPRWDYSFNLGGGNLLSSAADLTAFGQALIEPGFLSAEALALLYSAAWFGASNAQTRMISATGSNPGVQAALAIDPEHQITTAVLANTWGVGARSAEMVRLARKLTDMCAGRS